MFFLYAIIEVFFCLAVLLYFCGLMGYIAVDGRDKRRKSLPVGGVAFVFLQVVERRRSPGA